VEKLFLPIKAKPEPQAFRIALLFELVALV